MKKASLFPLLALISMISIGLTGCELIGDIFQAGLVMGIVLVVLVIGLILWLVRKIF